MSDGVWLQAVEIAKQRAEPLSEVLRDALRRYIRRNRGAVAAEDEHTHQWIDVTRIADHVYRETCATCGARRERAR